MSMEKSNQVPKIHISREKLQKVLPRNLKTGEEIENYIIKAVADYNRRQKSRDNAR